jgi:signal transduction histidine kinase
MHAIKGFASLLGRRLEAGSKEHRWAGLIVDGVSEADQILSSMLTLAAPQRLQLERVEPAALLADAVRQVSAEHVPEGAPSPWRIACDARAPAFAGDRVKLRQALRNLIANAVEVQPGGGPIEVAALLEQDELVLRVRDGGPGIPAELRGKVLDPFFTTRAQGTGLGLALASTIARLHGGRVDVSPSRCPLGGAEIALRLPHRPA